MPTEDIGFSAFFAAKIKERGVTLKKLSEATGIAPVHLENLIHGRFENLPSAPYLRGYLVHLGKALDFDGEAWWEKIKKEGLIKNSGSDDTLPDNRFLKQSPKRFIWIAVAVAIVIIYLAFQLPVIFGGPSIAITFPAQNPFTTSSSTATITGSVSNADSLSLNGDSVTIAPDGSWEKTVLLQSGVNTFQIAAKKLLGREADVSEEIIYNGLGSQAATATASSTATSTASGTSSAPSGSEISATGTL